MSNAAASKSADRRGIAVYCGHCERRKKPIGRSAALVMSNSLCGNDCKGYNAVPYPGSLWPGELESEFGFPVADYATEEVSGEQKC